MLPHHLGQAGAAEREQRSTLALCTEALGAEHPVTVGCHRGLDVVRGTA